MKRGDRSNPSPADSVASAAAKEAGEKGKLVVAMPTKDGKVRTLHNAQLHLEVTTLQPKGKGGKGNSNSTVEENKESAKDNSDDDVDDDGAEDDAPTGATGGSDSKDSTGAETGASTGVEEDDASTGASTGGGATASDGKHATKLQKVEKELKEANKELLGLETSLKMPVDKTTEQEAVKRGKDEEMDRAGQNIDKLEEALKMK